MTKRSKMSALSILAEECELLNDSKYRSYITQVEKALKSFDSTSEWADLISALGKLNKVCLPILPISSPVCDEKRTDLTTSTLCIYMLRF